MGPDTRRPTVLPGTEGTMRIARYLTVEGCSPFESIPFRYTNSEIRNPDGSLVFEMKRVEVPEAWSQVASDILA